MKRKTPIIMVAIILSMVVLSLPVYAKTTEQVNLDEAFNQVAIISFDNFNGKAFEGGKIICSYYDDYKIYSRDNRVLLPIRFTISLISSNNNSNNDGYWQIDWNQNNPKLVQIYNGRLNTKISLTIGSKIMKVNGKDVKIEVPAQIINNRTLLPLRAIGEALGRDIYWQDRMIILSNSDDNIDISSEVSQKVLNKCKSLLIDNAEIIDGQKQLTPVYVYNGISYYATIETKVIDGYNTYYNKLYSLKADKSVDMKLPGYPNINGLEITNNILYFPTIIDGKTYLYQFDFITNISKELCCLTTTANWNKADGWIRVVEKFGDRYLVVLHTGDLTMGGESIYILENEKMTELASMKYVSDTYVSGDKVYLTDFNYNDIDSWGSGNNIIEIDMITKTVRSNIGQNKYTYDIRSSSDGYGYCTSGLNAITIVDGKLYVPAYAIKGEGQDVKGQLAVINLEDKSQTLHDVDCNGFILKGDEVQYIDYKTHKYISYNLSNGNKITLIDESINEVAPLKNLLYFTKIDNKGNELAGLFCYDFKSKTVTKVSSSSVDELEEAENYIYYITTGYDPGICKIGTDMKEIPLESNQVYDSKFCGDNGIVYNLIFQKALLNVR